MWVLTTRSYSKIRFNLLTELALSFDSRDKKDQLRKRKGDLKGKRGNKGNYPCCSVLTNEGYDGTSSNLAGTDCVQVQMAPLQNSNADPYALHGGADPITCQPSNTSISAAACATTEESILASHASTSASSAAFIVPSTVAPSTAAAKPQPKALHVKKWTVAVASSVRSNKKVFSLVDKKAAKEEMQEAEEEEVEDALMILEKKRQREIENGEHSR